jgi:hypothetical protein
MLPYVITSISGFSTYYLISASAGLTISPYFLYPECPTLTGPQPIPLGVDIGCKLYDSGSNLIKALTMCTIPSTLLSPGNTYYVKYYYVPNPYQSALSDSIMVVTISAAVSCSVIGNPLIYV